MKMGLIMTMTPTMELQTGSLPNILDIGIQDGQVGIKVILVLRTTVTPVGVQIKWVYLGTKLNTMPKK